MSEEDLQKQDLRSKEQKEVHDIREQVWEVADSILESGRYPKAALFAFCVAISNLMKLIAQINNLYASLNS